MDSRLIRQAYKIRDLKAGAKAVLVNLCWHMNGGNCYPSVETIAEECGMGRTAVFNALDQLSEKGYVKRVRLGKKCNNRYQINLEVKSGIETSLSKKCSPHSEPVKSGKRTSIVKLYNSYKYKLNIISEGGKIKVFLEPQNFALTKFISKKLKAHNVLVEYYKKKPELKKDLPPTDKQKPYINGKVLRPTKADFDALRANLCPAWGEQWLYDRIIQIDDWCEQKGITNWMQASKVLQNSIIKEYAAEKGQK